MLCSYRSPNILPTLPKPLIWAAINRRASLFSSSTHRLPLEREPVKSRPLPHFLDLVTVMALNHRGPAAPPPPFYVLYDQPPPSEETSSGTSQNGKIGDIRKMIYTPPTPPEGSFTIFGEESVGFRPLDFKKHNIPTLYKQGPGGQIGVSGFKRSDGQFAFFTSLLKSHPVDICCTPFSICVGNAPPQQRDLAGVYQIASFNQRMNLSK
jgi:hypothetical protein